MRHRYQPGFTLVELLVAVALSGVIAGISVLAYQRIANDLRLNQVARQVMLDLLNARSQALARNAGQRVVFLSAQAAYQPQQQVGSSYQDDGGLIRMATGVDVVGCTASGAAVTFRPRGNAVTFGTITLRSSSGGERQVIVDIAGRVRVQ